jgi:hypothetical protein
MYRTATCLHSTAASQLPALLEAASQPIPPLSVAIISSFPALIPACHASLSLCAHCAPRARCTGRAPKLKHHSHLKGYFIDVTHYSEAWNLPKESGIGSPAGQASPAAARRLASALRLLRWLTYTSAPLVPPGALFPASRFACSASSHHFLPPPHTQQDGAQAARVWAGCPLPDRRLRR